MYQCNDVDLLKHTDVSVFTKFTEKRMQEAIDYYIDNVEYHKSLKPLTEKAVNGGVVKAVDHKLYSKKFNFVN